MIRKLIHPSLVSSRYFRRAFNLIRKARAIIIGKGRSVVSLKQAQADPDEQAQDGTDGIATLRNALSEVEFYQPLYRLDQALFTSAMPRRPCLDRADAILNACGGNVAGTRFLDVGSSLGFFSFYLADRGAQVMGLENNEGNLRVAQLVKSLVGLNPEFMAGALDQRFVDQLPDDRFECALLLSVLHHIVHYRGIPFTQVLLRKLLRKIPVLFVELALKDEKADVFWRPAQPDDPLALFALCENAQIELLGEFPTHLSEAKRPFYKITRGGTFYVNRRPYNIEKVFHRAYRDSPIGATRTYYLAPGAFIKAYRFAEDSDLARCNQEQIIREIANYTSIRHSGAQPRCLPQMLGFEIGAGQASIVLTRLDGELLSDRLGHLSPREQAQVLQGIIRGLAELRSLGLHHNDLRCWNIVVGERDVYLIDLGFASGVQLEETKSALLWLMAEMARARVLTYEYPRRGVPLAEAAQYGPVFEEIAEWLLRSPDPVDLDALDHEIASKVRVRRRNSFRHVPSPSLRGHLHGKSH
ncbi:MAG: methyltransferase domain-containing protein [Armatimonadetes bacterium]|nr:methyltransferase domain-containing protein [Armatimonadota bacterium]